MNFNNFSIAQRLALGFACVLTLSLISNALGIWQHTRLTDEVQTVTRALAANAAASGATASTAESSARIDALGLESTLWQVAVGIGSLVLGTMVAWRLTVSITVPLRRAQTVAERIADMDLCDDGKGAPALAGTKNETGRLLHALERMRITLRDTVAQVRTSTDSIATASSEIATGNQDLSSRTEQTASNLQKAASSMEQLTGTVKQSVDSARQANQLASSAAEVAARGGVVVSQVVATMDDINGSSKKISDIIGVIDGIAFQTNILALNAAVEAARAGEQGRGFAVVASEVRSLAQRSAEAAKEIKSLIGASVEKVEGGSRLVADAGQTMDEIVGSVKRVADIIGEITAASAEQSDGIGQVNGSVSELDQMTQQNAALVEQSAAAAESLREQAGRLAKVVATFRIDGGRPAAAPAPSVARHVAPAPKPVTSKPAAPRVAAASKPSTAAAPRVDAPAPRPAAAPKPAAPKPADAPAAGRDDDWETF